jgi:valyl-tRNA synthetase
MAKRSVAAVREGRLKISPKFHEKTWFQWLENIRPWYRAHAHFMEG